MENPDTIIELLEELIARSFASTGVPITELIMAPSTYKRVINQIQGHMDVWSLHQVEGNHTVEQAVLRLAGQSLTVRIDPTYFDHVIGLQVLSTIDLYSLADSMEILLRVRIQKKLKCLYK